MDASNRTAARRVRWSLGDVLDFECAVEEAKKRSDGALEHEGEVLRRTLANGPLDGIPRQTLLFAWLELRRTESPGSAGAEIDHAFRFARTLMWITGVLLGGVKWKGPLRAAAAAIETDWKDRLREAAQVMLDLIEESLTHTARIFLLPERLAEKGVVIGELKRQFRDDLARFEGDSHRKLIDLFRHSRVDVRASAAAIFGDDLFSEEAWKVFGLSWQALAGLGAFGGGIGGALIGAHGELAVPTGVPTTVGASIGGVAGALTGGFAAAVLGKKVAQPKVRLATGGSQHRGWFGKIAGNAAAWFSGTGTEIIVGPLRGENFPYILLDRAMGLFCYLASRTHARRDPASIEAARLKETLDRAAASTGSWNAELRGACKKFVRELRKPSASNEAGSRFRDLLTAHLEVVALRPFHYGTEDTSIAQDASAKGR